MYSNVLSCSNMIEQYEQVIEYCFVVAVSFVITVIKE